MSDSSGADSADKRKRQEYTSLGIVFAAVGVCLMLTLDSWVIGLPFVILGITFFATAFTASPRRDADSPD
jgi:hypothetical protein